MKHDQVSERGVTSPYRAEEENEREKELEKEVKESEGKRSREFLSLFLCFSDIRTRIRRLVERRKIGGTNEVRERLLGGEEDPENIVQERSEGKEKDGEKEREEEMLVVPDEDENRQEEH